MIVIEVIDTEVIDTVDHWGQIDDHCRDDQCRGN